LPVGVDKRFSNFGEVTCKILCRRFLVQTMSSVRFW